MNVTIEDIKSIRLGSIFYTRDKAIITILCEKGMTANLLSRLNLNDVVLFKKGKLVAKKKIERYDFVSRKKPVIVKLSERGRAAIIALIEYNFKRGYYRRDRFRLDKLPLVVSKFRQRMSPATIVYMVRQTRM